MLTRVESYRLPQSPANELKTNRRQCRFSETGLPVSSTLGNSEGAKRAGSLTAPALFALRRTGLLFYFCWHSGRDGFSKQGSGGGGGFGSNAPEGPPSEAREHGVLSCADSTLLWPKRFPNSTPSGLTTLPTWHGSAVEFGIAKQLSGLESLRSIGCDDRRYNGGYRQHQKHTPH